MTLEKQHIPHVVPNAALLKIGFSWPALPSRVIYCYVVVVRGRQYRRPGDEEIIALLAGFLCLKPSRKSSVEGRKTEMSIGKIILLTKTSAELLVSLLLEFEFGSSQYEGLVDKELTDDLKVRLN